MNSTDRHEENRQRVDKLFGILNYMNNVDMANTYAKTQALILGRQLRKRRILFIRNIAALLAITLAGTAIWLSVPGPAAEDEVIERFHDDIVLTMPDGSEIILDHDSNEFIASQTGVSVLLADGSLVYEKSGDEIPRQVRYSNLFVPKGRIFDMVLEDGTRIWLNADTRIIFPMVFPKGERRVTLDGEAYFSVTHDSQRPFVVETGAQTLTVLGTEFNICAYSEELFTSTVLVSGSVCLRAPDDMEGTVIVPGQLAVLRNGVSGYQLSNVNTTELASWRSGMFVFDGHTLEDIMQKIARWYDLEYTFDNHHTAMMTMRGNMPVYDDVGKIFDNLEFTDKIIIETQGRNVTIRQKR